MDQRFKVLRTNSLSVFHEGKALLGGDSGFLDPRWPWIATDPSIFLVYYEQHPDPTGGAKSGNTAMAVEISSIS